MINILLCTFVDEYYCEKLSEFQNIDGKVEEELTLCMLIQNLKGFWDVKWI